MTLKSRAKPASPSLYFHSSPEVIRLKYAGLLLAALIGLYIAIESPLSGMSLNPARSFGSALLAGQWHGIWLYFVAPPMAMLLAAEVYRRACPGSIARLPHYPVSAEKR